jgi:hypothetical protein
MLSVKAGLQCWGDKAKDALVDEQKLFIKEKVFEAVFNSSEEQYKNVLHMHCSWLRRGMAGSKQEHLLVGSFKGDT